MLRYCSKVVGEIGQEVNIYLEEPLLRLNQVNLESVFLLAIALRMAVLPLYSQNTIDVSKP